MAENGLAPQVMAERIGDVSASAVVKWMRDERLPRSEQMRRIYEVTQGSVSPNDFVLTPNSSQPVDAAGAAA